MELAEANGQRDREFDDDTRVLPSGGFDLGLAVGDLVEIELYRPASRDGDLYPVPPEIGIVYESFRKARFDELDYGGVCDVNRDTEDGVDCQNRCEM